MQEKMTNEIRSDLRTKFRPTTTPRYCSECLQVYCGFLTEVVERKVGRNKTVDLIGCFDLLSVGHNKFIGVQVTTHSHAKDHIDKMLAEPRLKIWLLNGGVAELQTFNRTRTTFRRGFFTLGKDGNVVYEEAFRGTTVSFLDAFDNMMKESK